MRIQFKEDFKSSKLDLQNGEYSRTFNRSEQPFEVTEEEWAYLSRTGFFDLVKDAPPPPAQGEQLQQSTQSEQQNTATQRRASKRAQGDQQSDQK